MVLAYHFIFTAYGFWLPNDPRGSWSDTVRAFDLIQFGPATKVMTTASLARAPHDRDVRQRAKLALKHSPVRFNGHQARAIVQGFDAAQREHRYKYLALAILPDHVHLLVERHPRDIDAIARHLKAKATARMSELRLHPLANCVSKTGRVPSLWSRSHWCPFVSDEAHLKKAIRYVESNPLKSGLLAQRWRIVKSPAQQPPSLEVAIRLTQHVP